MSTRPIEETRKLIDEVMEVYPEKTKKDRAKHVKPNDPAGACGTCQVKSNVKSRPGVMTVRGCAFAGAKGVVWGPVKDQVTISHGPVGCGQYSWWSRRNYYNGQTGIDTFGAMHITTDFQEKDIVYGGDKGLAEALREVRELFPLARGIGILSECPVGLIGDDIEAVSRRVSAEFSIPIVPVRCEGFRGVSQSLGHHIANDTIRDFILGKGGKLEKTTPYDVNIIGDYNIGGDAWSSRKILEEMGLRVVAQWTGDSSVNELAIAHKAKLNLIHCYRSMNYICRHMEEAYGIPWVEFNFFGPTKIYESIRRIASHFDDRIKERAGAVIAKYKPLMDEVIGQYRPKLEGKKEFENPWPEEKVREVSDWTKTEEYKGKNFARKHVKINPAKACQPLGAVFCASGFEGTMPFVQGAQGCVAYFRSHLSRHFKEPMAAISTSMTEDAAVFGGLNNMFEGLENAYALYNPRMLAVCTTCMAEVIGDDLNSYIRQARDKGLIPKDLPVPFAHTPSFVGSYLTGYDNMMKGILQTVTAGKKGDPRERDLRFAQYRPVQALSGRHSACRRGRFRKRHGDDCAPEILDRKDAGVHTQGVGPEDRRRRAYWNTGH